MNDKRTLALGTWISVGAPPITEMASGMGFDWLLFDLEHGFMQESDLLANMQAVEGGVKVIVRMGDFRPGFIARVLDWGADGIMMPHVSNAAYAKAIVNAMRYPPFGNRGFSSSSRSFGYGKSAPKETPPHESPLLLAQIENYEGVMNVSEIAAVEGVDLLFIGPRDLSLDLSVTQGAMPYDHAVAMVVTAAANARKQVGILLSPQEDAAAARAAGFDCLAIGSDMSVLRAGYNNIITNHKTIK